MTPLSLLHVCVVMGQGGGGASSAGSPSESFVAREHIASTACQDVIEEFKNLRFSLSEVRRTVEDVWNPFTSVFVKVRGPCNGYLITAAILRAPTLG